MKNNKKCINSVIVTLLMFSVLLGVISVFTKSVILNDNTYTKMLTENGTYKQVTESIYKKIDSSLSAKGLNIDIKESIITEADIKKEADNVISNLLMCLKSGENNMPPINTDVYKQRVKDVLESFVGKESLSNKELSFDNKIHFNNMVCVQIKPKFDYMISSKSPSNKNDDLLITELASREELEAQGRAMLREKGLTEGQARQKLAEKGLSEQDVWNMLEQEGYLDEENSSQSSSQNSSENSSENNDGSENSTVSEGKTGQDVDASNDSNKPNVADSVSQNKSTGNMDVLIDEKINEISNKLLTEAGTIIDKEIEKLNINGLLQSNLVKLATKVTSVFYNFNLIFIICPIVLIAILIGVNKRDIKTILKCLSYAVTFAGAILLIVSLGAYGSKIYEGININTVYLKDFILTVIKYFLISLYKCGLITFILGLILMIPNFESIVSLLKKKSSSF